MRRYAGSLHIASAAKLAIATLAIASLLLVVGCGRSGPEVVPVTGRLTHQGQPLAGMVVWFKPAEGRPSWGATDADGRFKLNYSRGLDGARIGTHKVWVKYDPQPLDPAEEMAQRAGRKQPSAAPRNLDVILSKYGSETESPLEVSVAAGVGHLEIQLD